MGNWNERRVFITGSTGLVGSWLTKSLLDKGAYVVVLLRDWDPQSELIRSQNLYRVNVINGSLEDYNCLERAINEHEIDTVFHLGAQTIVGTALRNPLPTFEANIRGTYHLLEACRTHQKLIKRIVIASSDKAYGESDVLPYTEEMPPNGKHLYDVSKSCTDLISQTYHHTYGLPLAIARCGNIYGGGDLNWSRIVPGTIRSFYYNQSPVIRSDGLFTRDYVFVEDAINAYLVMAEALQNRAVRGEAFNFGPMKPCSVLEIVSAIQKLMQKEDLPPRILNEAKGEIRDQYLQSSKAAKILKWTPLYSLEEGLAKTLQWYQSYLNAQNKEVFLSPYSRKF